MFGVLAQEGGPLDVVFGSFENTALWVILGISLVALVFAYYLVREVLAAPEGTEKMKEIAKAIQEGAAAYLSRQFRTVGVFLVILGVALFFILPVLGGGGALGVLDPVRTLDRLHPGCGVLGDHRATSACGSRCGPTCARPTPPVSRGCARRCRSRSAPAAWPACSRSGLGLLGATAILMIYQDDAAGVLVGFGFGGALLAMFMRVGGGIFTKAADVGADLVGKVEQGIPEDDPRNAATIADNVGDNVGDCAGMAADLFESYEVTLVASIILGAAAFAGSAQGAIAGVMFPLFVRAIGVVTSIVGILTVTPALGDRVAA